MRRLYKDHGSDDADGTASVAHAKRIVCVCVGGGYWSLAQECAVVDISHQRARDPWQ